MAYANETSAYPSVGAGVAALGAGSPIAPPKQSAMTEHAQRLHIQAEHLAKCNSRLYALLERMYGPTPETTSGPGKDQAGPSGVLYVAQFGAERIGLEIEKLGASIARLENVA